MTSSTSGRDSVCPPRDNVSSRSVGRPHTPRDFLAALTLDQGDVVLALQVKPELGAVPEITAQPYGGVGGDRAPAIENVRDSAGWNADIKRQTIGGELARGKLSLQKTTGWTAGGTILSSVVSTISTS
jgi:hypothetical protein